MARPHNGKKRERLAGLSIAFDLDGTLVDTAPDLVRVTNEMIALEGVGETDFKLARQAVGYGSRRLLTDAFERAEHSVPDDRVDALREQFLRSYADNICELSQVYPGVLDTLGELRRHGASLSVCTNKPGWLARPLLAELGMTHWFERIVGGDDARRPKPDRRHVYMAAGHRNADHIAMVGDAFPDMGAASNAGALAVLMTYGYSYGPQIRLRADMRLRDFRELTPALIDWYAPRRAQTMG